MTDPNDTESQLLAYVYGELSPAEASAFEARLAGDAELRAEAEGLIAMRDLLKADLRYGAEQGLDLPPPHLADAILRAEVLARPTEVRQAHARSGKGGLLSKLSLWLVGGGIAVSAAATLVITFSQSSNLEPGAADALPAATAPPAGQAQLAMEPTLEDAPGEAEPAARPTAARPTEDPPPDVAERKAPAPVATAAPAPERAAATGALAGAGDADGPYQARADEKKSAKDRPALDEGDGEYAKKKGKAEEGEALGRDIVEGRRAGASEGAARSSAETDDLAFADEEAPPADETRAKSAPAKPARRAEPSAPAMAPPPPPASQPVSPGGAGVGTKSSSGPPPIPQVLKEKLAERERSSREQPKSEAKADKGGDVRKRASEASLEEELRMTLTSAEMELAQGRALDAYDLFAAAAARDPKGKHLGVVPHVGKMKALHALGRHGEVLTLVPLVKRPGIKAPAVADGILVAARSAEALGRYDYAKKLYRELLVVKDKRREAERALERLDARPAVRSKASAPAASEPAAAAEAQE